MYPCFCSWNHFLAIIILSVHEWSAYLLLSVVWLTFVSLTLLEKRKVHVCFKPRFRSHKLFCNIATNKFPQKACDILTYKTRISVPYSFVLKCSKKLGGQLADFSTQIFRQNLKGLSRATPDFSFAFFLQKNPLIKVGIIFGTSHS